jgi:hypothetical protein
VLDAVSIFLSFTRPLPLAWSVWFVWYRQSWREYTDSREKAIRTVLVRRSSLSLSGILLSCVPVAPQSFFDPLISGYHESFPGPDHYHSGPSGRHALCFRTDSERFDIRVREGVPYLSVLRPRPRGAHGADLSLFPVSGVYIGPREQDLEGRDPENQYIRVCVAPEMGGKILGAFEKGTGTGGRRISGYSRDIWGPSISGIPSEPWQGMKMDRCIRCHTEQNRVDGCVACHK